MTMRPSFIVSVDDVPEKAHVYPQGTERMGPVRHPGKDDGLPVCPNVPEDSR